MSFKVFGIDCRVINLSLCLNLYILAMPAPFWMWLVAIYNWLVQLAKDTILMCSTAMLCLEVDDLAWNIFMDVKNKTIPKTSLDIMKNVIKLHVTTMFLLYVSRLWEEFMQFWLMELLSQMLRYTRFKLFIVSPFKIYFLI